MRSWLIVVLLLINIVGCQKQRNINSISIKETIKPLPTTQLPNYRDLDDIKESGELIAVIENAPLSYFLKKGQPMGFEYEILNHIAHKLNLKLKIITVKTYTEALKLIYSGRADVIAYGIAVNKTHLKELSLTTPLYESEQVLIQNRLNPIRDPHELNNKPVYTTQEHYKRLTHLADETGAEIDIKLVSDSITQEELIDQVIHGKIDYAVADALLANLFFNCHYNIDVKTAIGLKQRFSFGTHPFSKALTQELNQEIKASKRSGYIRILKQKYYSSSKWVKHRVYEFTRSKHIQSISQYDNIIKKHNQRLNWDWRLLASQIYTESNFQPRRKSWMGAVGLMQIMPATGAMYNTSNLTNPDKNIYVGIKYLCLLEKYWKTRIPNEDERLKFILASYNAGPGHVIDAQKLTKKNGGNPLVWDNNVERFLLLKSKPKYFNDPSCKHGYCRGKEPVNYVNKVLDLYDKYQDLVPL